MLLTIFQFLTDNPLLVAAIIGAIITLIRRFSAKIENQTERENLNLEHQKILAEAQKLINKNYEQMLSNLDEYKEQDNIKKKLYEDKFEQVNIDYKILETRVKMLESMLVTKDIVIQNLKRTIQSLREELKERNLEIVKLNRMLKGKTNDKETGNDTKSDNRG